MVGVIKAITACALRDKFLGKGETLTSLKKKKGSFRGTRRVENEIRESRRADTFKGIFPLIISKRRRTGAGVPRKRGDWEKKQQKKIKRKDNCWREGKTAPGCAFSRRSYYRER